MASQAARTRMAAGAPLALLAVYGVAFAMAALGRSLPVFDDHPGQLYRLWHVVTHGPAPWAWNFGWWAGYPELQFYPPAFAYLGALIHGASLGTVTVAGAYQVMVWLTYLAPGLTAWMVLTRALGDGWRALPGAFVASTLSLWPSLMSGVEGGVHVGMAPARLGWAIVPLLAAALAAWTKGPFPLRTVAPLTALIVLLHPAHLPAAVTLLAVATLAGTDRRPRAVAALHGLAVAALLTAFWTVPLVARLAHTRALAWGTLTPASLGEALVAHPLALVLIAGAIGAGRLSLTPFERILVRWPWAMAVVVVLDAAVLEPLGLAWLPADRVLDGFWLALVLAAGVGAGHALAWLAAWRRVPVGVAALAVVLAAVALSLAGRDTLTLWPRTGAWPSYAATERGLRLPALWAALREAPAGRVLFVRSGVPLAFGTEWWRPHTHVTALTPLVAGRAIVNGTFTHPSPIAALVYRGDAGLGPITRLVERRDGRTLFGAPLETLGPATFNALARRLGVSVVVALDEDVPRLAALADNAVFATRRSEPPFVIWQGPPVALPHPLEPGPWRVPADRRADGWASLGVAYYPLWRAAAGGVSLPTRRGALGDLEAAVPAGIATVELHYWAGVIEWVGVGLTVLGVLAWVGARGTPPLRWTPSTG